MRRLLVPLTVAGLLLAGCIPRSEPTPAEPTDAPAAWDTDVTWQPCPEVPRDALASQLPGGILPGVVMELLTGVAVSLLTAGLSYDCATLPVPQDWAAPDEGETFDLALVRVRRESSDQDRIGSLVINPGGPGGSGVDAAALLSFRLLPGLLPDDVLDRFDIVGFDPRGVGRSSPIECFTDEDLDEMFGAEPDPRSQAEFDAAVAASQRRTEACGNKYGETLSHFSTRQTAHDLDAVRLAVGDEQLTYLGYSYGTLLGAVYAHLYPGNIRAMVLDGAVDPRPDPDAVGQAAGFERALDNFAGWCNDRPQCPLGPDTRAAVAGAIDAARQSPVTGGDGREATAGWVFLAVIASLYTQELWQPLGNAIADLDQGDPSGVFRLADTYTGRDADGSYPNMFDANTAINCADDDSEATVAEVRDQQEQGRGEHPIFGAPLAVMALDCVHWPAEPDPYPAGAATGAPPIVVVGTTGDPATPYEATARLAALLGTGVVLTWEGEGHTVYPKEECISDAVDAYLIDLTTPADGTTCTP